MSTVHRPFPVIGCVTSAGLVVLGIVGAVLMIYMSVRSLSEGLTRFRLPGKSEQQLAEAGKYTIYHEHRSHFDGQSYSTMGQISGLKITVRNKTTGESIPVTRPAMSSNYSLGARQGFAVLTFRVKTPGTYVISGAYPQDQSGAAAVFTTGRGIVGTMLLYMFGGFGLGGLLGALGLVVGIIAIVRYAIGARRPAGADAVG